MAITEDSQEQGRRAEEFFTAWLNSSEMSYLRPDQSRGSMPIADGRRIKRIDFLVGVPAIGSIGIEVKGISLYGKREVLTLDCDPEIERLEQFARAFCLPTYIVNVGKDGSFLWFRLEQFLEAGSYPIQIKGGYKNVISLPKAEGLITSPELRFYETIGQLMKRFAKISRPTY